MKHFVFVADTHLYPRVWDSVPEIEGDSYRAFDQVVDYVLRTSAEALVIGGDIFDRTPTSDAMRYWLTATGKLKDHHIPVYAIQGQHGKTSNGIPWHEVSDGCQDIHAKIIEILPGTGLKMFSLERMSASLLQAHLAELADPKYADISILVLHQLAKGTVPEIQGAECWDFDPAWVPPQIKLVLMGDLHEPREVFSRAARIIYNGSTVLKAISETDEKSFLDVQEDLSVERIPLVTRIFKRLSIFSPENMRAALKSLDGLPPGSVAYIRYDPRVERVEEMMRAACKVMKLIPMFRTVITVQEAVGTPVEIPESVTLAGCLGMLVDRGKDPNLFSFSQELLVNESPEEAIREAKKRITGE